MDVTSFLQGPEKHPTGSVVVLFGDDAFLKQAALQSVCKMVLAAEDVDGVTHFDGKVVDLLTVRDELWTVSMWGERRLVIVDNADDFVSSNRAALEKYVSKPAKKSVLLLDVRSWPKNARLARAVDKVGLALRCAAFSEREAVQWLGQQSRETYGKKLNRDAARLIVDLAGTDVGLLYQQLAKLAAYVGDRPQIGTDDVRPLVGGWTTQTAFVMAGAARDGNIGFALSQLEKLLVAGEAPPRILGAIRTVFARLAQAHELACRGMELNSALRRTGVFPREMKQSAAYLKRIGPSRAQNIYGWLIAADESLKGRSRLSERVELEGLLVRLSGKA